MKRQLKVALLTNFLPFYRVPMLETVATGVAKLRTFVSVEMEADRDWKVVWGGLDVVVLKSISLLQRQRSRQGYEDHSYVHFSYDLLPRLYRFQPDVIISGELGVRSCMAALFRMLHPRTRLILWATLSERTERNRGWLRRTVRRFLVHRADAFLVNGQSSIRYLRGLRVPDERIFVFNQAVDTKNFRRTMPFRVENGETLRLLYTGQLIERKCVVPMARHLILWCTAHPERRIAFTVLGNGPEREKLLSLSLPVNLELEVRPSVSHQELAPFYQAAHIYVYPTLADEWGLVVNEAMSAGLPVLGSIHSQAVEELVTDGVTGWCFDSSDDGNTAAVLDRALMSSAEELTRMSEAAERRIAGLTVDFAAERMLSVIGTFAGTN